MSVTSKDIATRLGISQPTVSRILSGDKNYKVSPATREMIFATAEEMGYRANALARSLRSKRTDVIGLYMFPNVLDTRTEFFGYLYSGLQRGCETHRVDILVHKTFEGRSMDDVYGEMVDGRTDGAIIYLNPNVPLVDRLRRSPMPMVAVADPLPGIPSVGCQDCIGMTAIMNYLWDKGHRRYAYVAPTHEATTVNRRRDTYDSFLQTKGVEPDARLVLQYERGHGSDAVDHVMALKRRPTALCCWNDGTAYECLRLCTRRGLRVPDDLAVVGYDGFEGGRVPVIDLVSVRVPWYEMAQTAVDLLINRVNGGEIPPETLLPVEFMPGTSA